ncbi:MAG: alpha/beta hydrolase [Candidatus Latescibacteria bacterium]|nr:alpha/beta hydrolase [Candidatus Latescibacterota bacterium]
MPFFSHDGLHFHYYDTGEGLPFFFQHGLGGDVKQPVGLFTPPPGFRLLAFDCRGHGETRPLGDPHKIRITAFADDWLALMDHLAIARAVIGGISMGAAVALNFTLRFPDRALGLILSRPAWLDGPNRKNVSIYHSIARLIRESGANEGLERFKQSEAYREVLHQSPDAAQSLVGQFEQTRAEETVVKLERIPADAPNHDRTEWRRITVPTLVLANRQDPIHPFEYGEVLARGIPGAEFEEITPKSVSKEDHARDVQRCIEEFLQRHSDTHGFPLARE